MDIALATWNGARFLPPLLDSIVAQSYPNWRLVVRDDGSSDDTCQILAAFAERHKPRVELVQDGRVRLGVTRNFEATVSRCRSNYIAFADQDDVWLPVKLERTMQRLLQIEGEHGDGTPILVHTDLRVVDATLRTIAPSFIRMMRLDPLAGAAIKRLLVRNVVTGCTMLANRALVERALPIPKAAAIHDWWLALVAVCLGRLEFIDEQTVLYRQHGANSIGAIDGWSFQSALARLREARPALAGRYAQAAALSETLRSRLLPQANEDIERFAQLGARGLWRRVGAALFDGYRDHGLMRTVAGVVLGGMPRSSQNGCTNVG
ncbi:MAG TPA: glycosyltransferase family 2 protein [Pararobbsia sp.]|nr:glycosyltransferase family 2 protein [Pararobbsia sp.]